MVSDDFFENFRKAMKKRMEDFFNMDSFFNFDRDFDKEFEEMEKSFEKANEKYKNDPNVKHYSISYRYGTGMDKPEWKISGNLSEEEMNKLVENIQKGNFNFGLNFTFPRMRNEDVLDFKEIAEQPKSNMETIKKLEKPKEKKEKVEPYADFIENDNDYTIVLEMPGVSQNDVKIEVDEKNNKQLNVRAETHRCIYKKSFKFKTPIKIDNIKISANNGIIQIIIYK